MKGSYLFYSSDRSRAAQVILDDDHSVSGLTNPLMTHWRLSEGDLLFMGPHGGIAVRFSWRNDRWSGRSADGCLHTLIRRPEYRSSVQPVTIVHFNPLHISRNNHNPALIRLDAATLLAVVRSDYHESHPYAYLAVLDNSYGVSRVTRLDDAPVQDSKLFWYRGRLRMLHGLHGASRLWMSPVELLRGVPAVHFDEAVQLQCAYPGRPDDQPEKNWGPFVHEDELYFLYRRSPHVVLRYDDVASRVVYDETLVTDVSYDADLYPYLHGCGQPVRVTDDLYLATFHTVRKDVRNYTIGYYLFQARPPFAVVRMCDEPLIRSELLPNDLLCSDPGQARKGAFGYDNGANLVFIASAMRSGDAVILGVGLNDVRSVFLEYRITDLVTHTHPMTLPPPPRALPRDDLLLDSTRRWVQVAWAPEIAGYLEPGTHASCVRWTALPDRYTPIRTSHWLRATKLLSFELGAECPLSSQHPLCPVNDPARYASTPLRTPICDDLVIQTASDAYRHHGFRGFVTFWGYNDPARSLDRQLDIVRRVRANWAPARFMMLTNGMGLQPDGECARKLACFDAVIVNCYPEVSQSTRMALSSLPVVFRRAPKLDARRRNYDGPMAEFRPDIGPCHRPTYELLVDHFGNVCLCCNDYRCEVDVGNLQRASFDEVLRAWSAAAARPSEMDLTPRHFTRAPAVCRRCVVNTPQCRIRDLSWTNDDTPFFEFPGGQSDTPIGWLPKAGPETWDSLRDEWTRRLRLATAGRLQP